MSDVEVIPLQILPGTLYKVGIGTATRLRYGADLENENMLVIAIKAAHKDPKLIAQAVENFLIRDANEHG